MSQRVFSIRMLTEAEIQPHLPILAHLLQDAVEGGASVGYLPPLALEPALAYWHDVMVAVANGHRVLLVAEQDGKVVGTVQLDLATKPNGLHRAEVSKLLVHSQARRQGIAQQLMLAIEEAAYQHHRTTLVLDTLQGEPSELLYQKLGYTAAGTIPAFARVGSGELEPTVVYYKLLA
ncbi:GNAT family N-acetyltransferase [Hymenobacter taeanensis]|uniref:GNAT family N-acetyltransferase n=1 Tax=Hymenobacter taeanensis TaxID=2735321 RepID=A0A6M6BGW4_9BACT|nr:MULTISPECIES: GNAT family N-acetyltransferase [Hymenobacter]QJX46265.1 GNAT family N-acetyltransferase [Hymenobacter taeanensis]UOQ80119.1 GNAT family N-acetyltransferase [Hymenobacter sp. 5414T-23]